MCNAHSEQQTLVILLCRIMCVCVCAVVCSFLMKIYRLFLTKMCYFLMEENYSLGLEHEMVYIVRLICTQHTATI